MAKELEFTDIEEASAVFTDMAYLVDGVGRVSIYNAQTGEYVPVEPGQHIVQVAGRYEVHNTAPSRAKPATE